MGDNATPFVYSAKKILKQSLWGVTRVANNAASRK